MKPKILIIDDAFDTWLILRAILEVHHYHPVWASDSIQAMSLARLHQPRAILLDLGLPGGDGFMVLERLKANRLLSNIPVIVVTAREPGEAEEAARRLGAVDYLQKPIKADTLIPILEAMMKSEERSHKCSGR
jgi:DNA-binding response OmpR family regulator